MELKVALSIPWNCKRDKKNSDGLSAKTTSQNGNSNWNKKKNKASTAEVVFAVIYRTEWLRAPDPIPVTRPRDRTTRCPIWAVHCHLSQIEIKVTILKYDGSYDLLQSFTGCTIFECFTDPEIRIQYFIRKSIKSKWCTAAILNIQPWRINWFPISKFILWFNFHKKSSKTYMHYNERREYDSDWSLSIQL